MPARLARPLAIRTARSRLAPGTPGEGRRLPDLARAARRLVLAAATCLCGAAAQAETLGGALSAAYRTSGLLEQNRALLRAAAEDVAVAVSALYPVIDYVAQTRYVTPAFDNLTASLSLNAQLTVYDGGRNRLAIEAAKKNVLALSAQLTVVEQQVLGRAVAAYFSVLATAEFVALRENNVRLITRELRGARDRFEVGEVTRTDISLAEARLAQARSQLSSAEGDLAIAREEYRAVVGSYPHNLRTPSQPPMPVHSVDAARGVALSQHPQILQSQFDVAVAEINVRRALAQRNPTLTLGGSLALSDQVVDPSNSIELRKSLDLTLRGPIYQGGQISALYRQSVARADAARASLRITVETIRQNVGEAWSRLLVARATLEASRREVRAQQQAFEGVREEARLGARTTLDVLNAEQDLLDARTSVVQASANTYIAAYNLLSAMGLLTVEHLNLGIVTYDASAYYEAVKDAPVIVSPQARALDRIIKSIGRD